jgi:hypothetical protein
MAEAQDMLGRLQERGADSPARRLAAVVVSAELDRPLGEVLSPSHLAAWVRAAAGGWDDGRLRTWLGQEVERHLRAVDGLPGPSQDHVPPPLVKAAEAALARPMRLEAPLVMGLVDQPEVRALIRDVLQVTLLSFMRKLGAPLTESGLLGGMVGRATKSALGAATKSALGLASGVVSAVGAGLEQEAERKVREFLDDAMSGILQRGVNHVCDQKHQESYAALATGVLRSALQVSPSLWARQVRHADPVERGLGVLLVLRDFARSPAFSPWLEARLAPILDGRDALTVRQFLDGAGVLGPVQEVAAGVLGERLEVLFGGEPFAAWWAGLAAPPKKPRRRKTQGK